MSFSIRFPMVKESTGSKRGKRFRLVPAVEGLSGARGCAARMVRSAIGQRDSVFNTNPRNIRISRLHMRAEALWARVFAGQVSQEDPRIDAAIAEAHRLVRAMVIESEAREGQL